MWLRAMSKRRAHRDEWLRDVAPSADLRHWPHHDRSALRSSGIATSANWRTPITGRPCGTCVISPPTTRSPCSPPPRTSATVRPPCTPSGSAPPAQRAAGSVAPSPGGPGGPLGSRFFAPRTLLHRSANGCTTCGTPA
ncbi:DUF488 family protein [Streptomyces mirabilis]|uniref:hypothetical protein n=1 Tax=Streptomyces mirabilis TaxID=68239 RepID=UPI0036AD4786